MAHEHKSKHNFQKKVSDRIIERTLNRKKYMPSQIKGFLRGWNLVKGNK